MSSTQCFYGELTRPDLPHRIGELAPEVLGWGSPVPDRRGPPPLGRSYGPVVAEQVLAAYEADQKSGEIPDPLKKIKFELGNTVDDDRKEQEMDRLTALDKRLKVTYYIIRASDGTDVSSENRTNHDAGARSRMCSTLS